MPECQRNGEARLILLINGAFGIGKTTVARALVSRLPRAVLFDPELIGIPLQRVARLTGRNVDDFQDIRMWRRLTVGGLRVTRLFYRNVVVPMAFSNAAYLGEIRAGIGAFERRVLQICLIAPVEAVHDRLSRRRLAPADRAWQFRRAAQCCAVHGEAQFGPHVSVEQRDVNDIVQEILNEIIRSG